MRLPIAVAVLTAFALPAAAQRLDTRRINVVETAELTSCGFNAYDRLVLTDVGKHDAGKFASWNGAPAEDAKVDLHLIWEPAETNWRTPPFLGVGFTVPTDAGLSRDSVAGASVIVDGGKPIPLLYNASANRLIFAANRDTDNVGARIIGSDEVVLEILDSAGKALRRYSWDTRRLADAVETVSVVHWSCTTP